MSEAGRVLAFAGFRRHVADLARAVAFYCDGLGFTVDEPRAADGDAGSTMTVSLGARGVRSAYLRLGEQVIELVEHGASPVRHRAARGTINTSFQHFAIVAADIAAAHVRLMRCEPGTLTLGGPVRLPERAGGVSAFKFLDPDGHPLELIHFPPGSGDKAWQAPWGGANPTLGIDHSAIVIADAERSVAFYRDGLGFTLHARQLNQGPEQERLDDLERVIVDVVALRPLGKVTPHLELLGYRVPTARRDPSNPCADRLVWWADNPQAIAERVRQPGSAGVIELSDPDGHVHLLRMPSPSSDTR